MPHWIFTVAFIGVALYLVGKWKEKVGYWDDDDPGDQAAP